MVIDGVIHSPTAKGRQENEAQARYDAGLKPLAVPPLDGHPKGLTLCDRATAKDGDGLPSVPEALLEGAQVSIRGRIVWGYSASLMMT